MLDNDEQPYRSNASNQFATDPFDAWRVDASQGGDIGSYAPNGWMCNPRPGLSSMWERGPIENYWRTHQVRSAYNIPVFTEAWFVDGWPRHTDEPFQFENRTPLMGVNEHEIQRLSVNRHGGAQNCLFADWSVKRVGLKELWTLKWHRKYDINGPWTKAGGVAPEDWPLWMRKFKDY